MDTVTDEEFKAYEKIADAIRSQISKRAPLTDLTLGERQVLGYLLREMILVRNEVRLNSAERLVVPLTILMLERLLGDVHN